MPTLNVWLLSENTFKSVAACGGNCCIETRIVCSSSCECVCGQSAVILREECAKLSVPTRADAMFFIEEMGLVSHVPITAATSSSVLSVHWQPTHALPSAIILFLQDGSDNNVYSVLGSVIKPYLVPDQCSLFCLLLKLLFWLVLGVGLPILCVCMGGLCAAAGVWPWVTGDRASAVWQVGHVRACIGVLSSSCLPISPQFHFKQHTFLKGKDVRWHLESKPFFLVPVS